MKFVEAFEHMLYGNKIYLPEFVESKYVYINRDGYIVNQDGYRIPLDVHSDNWLVYEDMMTFKGAVRQMVEGKRVRIAWWRKDKFIELRANGFYNEKGELEDLDTLKLNNEWEIFE